MKHITTEFTFNVSDLADMGHRNIPGFTHNKIMKPAENNSFKKLINKWFKADYLIEKIRLNVKQIPSVVDKLCLANPLEYNQKEQPDIKVLEKTRSAFDLNFIEFSKSKERTDFLFYDFFKENSTVRYHFSVVTIYPSRFYTLYHNRLVNYKNKLAKVFSEQMARNAFNNNVNCSSILSQNYPLLMKRSVSANKISLQEPEIYRRAIYCNSKATFSSYENFKPLLQS